MSNTQRTETETGFASNGYADACPNFYLDAQRFGNVVEFPDATLTGEITRYNTFLDRKDVYVPQASKATRNLSHLAFEQLSRDNEEPGKSYDVDEAELKELWAKW